MNWYHWIYFASLLIAAAVMGWLAIYSRAHRDIPGSSQFTWTAVLTSVIAVFAGLSMTASSGGSAAFWFNMRFFGSALYPVAWLVFVAHYTGKQRFLGPVRIALLLVVPALTQIAVWTNHLHHAWVVRDVAFNKAGMFYIADIRERVPGIMYYIHVFYSYCITIVGLVMVFTTAAKMKREYRAQAMMFGLGVFIMVLGTILPSFNITPGNEINTLIPGMALGSVIMAWAVFRHRFLSIAPAFDTRRGQSTTLTILLFITVFGILLTGYMYYRHYEHGFRLKMEHELTAIAELKKDEIARWRLERMADARFLNENAVFTGLAYSFIANPSNTAASSGVRTWLRKIHDAYGYNQVLLLDANGAPRFTYPDTGDEVCVFVKSRLPEVASGRGVHFLDFHRVAPEKPVMLSVVVPVRYEWATTPPFAYVVLAIDPNSYLYPMISRWPAPSETAETLLVRRDGDEVVFLNELKYRKDTALKLRFPVALETLPAALAASGRTGVVEGIDYRGARVMAALLPIPDSPWFIVARMDLREVYAPVRERFWLLVVLVMAFILAAGTGVMYIWRRQEDKFDRELLEAAAALQRSEEFVRTVLDNLPVGIAVNSLNPDVRFEYINDNFLKFYRTTREELEKPDGFWAAVYEDAEFREALRARVLDDSLSGDPARMLWEDVPIRRAGERTTYITARNIPLPDRGQVISTVWDVTERHVTQERLRRYADDLQRSNVDLQQFAYVASHDLQEPLRMISSYLQLLERRYKDSLDEDASDFIKYAVDGAKRLQALITGLLEFSRVATHGKPFANVSVNETVDTVCRDLEKAIKEAGAVVRREDLPIIKGDATQIYRLFLNLIQNSVKFRRDETLPVITIAARNGSHEHIFSVSDNGIGIEERYFDRIFTIFQRLHAREEYPGTGIGLSICKRIVERHGGRIWVESYTGEGSTFYFSIPFIPAEGEPTGEGAI